MKNAIVLSLRRLLQEGERLLFPPAVTCLCCSRALSDSDTAQVCSFCREEMQRLQALQEENERREMGAQDERFAYVHAAYPYEGPVKTLISCLKFHSVRGAAAVLAEAMMQLPSGEEELIVPIPTTKRREKERGFNQSTLLARHIARGLGMPMEEILERRGEQMQQHRLPYEKRKQNLHGCMTCTRSVAGMRILLVDDVFTSGSTAAEAARALRQAGARSVAVFAAARAYGSDKPPEFLGFNP